MDQTLIIREIVNVLPYEDAETPSYDETTAKYTMIEAVTWDGDTIKLLLPRGEHHCTNTYLLADAIREE